MKLKPLMKYFMRMNKAQVLRRLLIIFFWFAIFIVGIGANFIILYICKYLFGFYWIITFYTV